jgi:hypothetical protein
MKSTTIIAFDQHAATTVAAVLVPGNRPTPEGQSAQLIQGIERRLDDGFETFGAAGRVALPVE